MLTAYLSRCFAGRLGRKNYLLAQAVYPVALLIVAIPILAVPLEIIDSKIIYQIMFGTYALCIYAWYFASGIGATIRRCHDRNHSGWYCLLLLVPILGIIIGFELLLGKAVEPNRFGKADNTLSVKKILAFE